MLRFIMHCMWGVDNRTVLQNMQLSENDKRLVNSNETLFLVEKFINN